MRNDDAAAHDQRDVERFFLLGTGHAQTIGLDDVVLDAIIAAQAGRSHQAHQLFVFSRQRSFQVGIVIEVVENV